MTLVPLYGPVAAGEPLTWTCEDALGAIQAPERYGADAAFVVSGDSVSDYGVSHGDIVFARRADGERPVSGDMVVAETEGAYCCKIYRHNALGEYLESHRAGQEPEPFLITGEVRLVGIVVSVQKEFRRRA